MAILGILRQYEGVSGQQINLAKSSIQFGHTVDAGVQAEIQGVLGITNLGGMGSCLNIHESLGGSKTKVFSYVRDRLQSRTTGWSVRLLSKGGKEVMVKSVATAVPTFVMSCYRLPKTITSKLTSAVANFWWSTNGQSGGMHWIAWERLCCSKQLGGLGFKSVDDFNTALLAKQLWRLLEYPDFLFARVFKSRYYRNSDPLDPIRSYSPSYGWRSIVSARSLVNKGLITRVGSGSSISIWSDPWVPAQFRRPALSNGPFKDPNLRLPHLIDRRTRSWQKDLLTQHFDPLDVALIEAIPLGSDTKDDYLGWHFTKTGKYTVKFGYETARMDIQGPFRALGSGPEIIPLLARVWKVPCPPKLQHFLWQVLSGCISISTNLRHRGVNCDVVCMRCGFEAEDINHAIFLCPPARQVWALANVPVGPQHFPMESNLDERPDVVVRVAESEAVTWQEAQVDIEGDEVISIPSRPSSGPRLGISLPRDFMGYRCYVDGSWKETDVFAGAGWCCILSQNTPPVLGATNFRQSLSPLHAEVESFLWAIRCMIGHDFRDVVFLTDCSDLVKMVSSPTDLPAFATYLDDIQMDREEFSSFSLLYVPRQANVRADSLARQMGSELTEDNNDYLGEEIEGDDGPPVSSVGGKRTRPSSTLPVRARKNPAHRSFVWQHFVQKDPDVPLSNCL
ncbi:PREDICTED: uncharacterized protein LOC104759984 [Camelina sativa]|uniref:Uncharacterized protein LOC104759984 n=1 Tax=Camelina sativa TaxID=90675 RepID=A0ABM0X5R2_CAMSA|nr:PREDICTED: uncharacterized protein LOC104759984 [Camelina sativa]